MKLRYILQKVLNKFAYFLLFTFCFSLFSLNIFSQYNPSWVVPKDKQALLAPYKFEPGTVKSGEKLYTTYCLSCHGTPGKNNALKMTPPPPDPANEEYQENTDGELFFKISEGKSPMPSFKSIIPEKDRWFIISYIRSFNKKYVQPKNDFADVPDMADKIKVKVSLDNTRKSVDVTLIQKSNNQVMVVKEFEAALYAKRYFGYLKIADAKENADDKRLTLIYPDDVPGDKDGNLNLQIRIIDEATGINVTKDTIFKIGVPVVQANLLDKRAWWNVRSMAPVWLIIAYAGSLLTVLGIIFYILSLIYSIWKTGKENI